VAEEVLRIARAHDRPGLIIAGDADESGYPLLLRSLAALDQHGDVHIDLGGIEFCDLAGLRAIVCAGRLGEDISPGRPVCLHAVPPRLRRIMQILGWDDRPGLAFDAASLSSENQPPGAGPGRADPRAGRASAAPGADGTANEPYERRELTDEDRLVADEALEQLHRDLAAAAGRPGEVHSPGKFDGPLGMFDDGTFQPGGGHDPGC
jgi:anti-anti-sigma regulatory factor